MSNAGHGIPAKQMCKTHLVSCHAEIHQEVGAIKRQKWNNTLGHMRWGQFLPNELKEKHEELAEEINNRAKVTGNGNGHNRDTKHKPREYGNLEISPEFVYGIPGVALKLYNRNVFRVAKDCECLQNNTQTLQQHTEVN